MRKKDIPKALVLCTFLLAITMPMCDSYQEEFPEGLDCSVSAGQTFEDIKVAAVTCMSCHNRKTPLGNFYITNYDDVYTQIRPGDPVFSPLYIEVTTGSMKEYSNQEINQTLFCWIYSGGAE